MKHLTGITYKQTTKEHLFKSKRKNRSPGVSTIKEELRSIDLRAPQRYRVMTGTIGTSGTSDRRSLVRTLIRRNNVDLTQVHD